MNKRKIFLFGASCIALLMVLFVAFDMIHNIAYVGNGYFDAFMISNCFILRAWFVNWFAFIRAARLIIMLPTIALCLVAMFVMSFIVDSENKTQNIVKMIVSAVCFGVVALNFISYFALFNLMAFTTIINYFALGVMSYQNFGAIFPINLFRLFIYPLFIVLPLLGAGCLVGHGIMIFVPTKKKEQPVENN